MRRQSLSLPRVEPRLITCDYSRFLEYLLAPRDLRGRSADSLTKPKMACSAIVGKLPKEPAIEHVEMDDGFGHYFRVSQESP